MPHSTRTLRTQDGLQLHQQTWTPESAPKAVLVVTHGIGEHSGRYGNHVAALTPAGYALYAYDLRGHGRSDGRRGHAPSYAHLLDDLELVIGVARQAYPEQPLFVFGHSMGGQITLNYALRRPQGLAGVIATDPWLGLTFEPRGWQLALARFMGNIWPTLAQPNGLDVTAISHDPEVVAAYRADPLVHDRITARLAVEAFAAAEWAVEHAPDLQMPALLMHGADDKITDPDTTQRFCERVGAPGCTYRRYAGLYHEIHHEPEKEMVFKDLLAWLAEHAAMQN